MDAAQEIIGSDTGFWDDTSCRVFANERDRRAMSEVALIRDQLKFQDELAGHLLFSTSGSMGGRKWVALSSEALLASARVVNAHLSVDASDRWLLALPTFHVGGMGILARCFTAGCKLVTFSGKWDPVAYHTIAAQQGVTFSSLVPTQLLDLVRKRLEAPSEMRGVLIGGGRLDNQTYQRAVELGWPVVETYGMTETCSQVATATVGDRRLQLLPSWEVKQDFHDGLLLKGNSILTSYVQCKDGVVQITDPKKNGWFLTGDRVQIQARTLTILGRSDRCVKILGELVNLDEVEQSFLNIMPKEENQLPASSCCVVFLEDGSRRGGRLILCVEGPHNIADADVAIFNQHCHPLHRIDILKVIHSFPRSPLGKITYAQLKDSIA